MTSDGRASAGPRIALGTVHAPPAEPYPRLLVTRHWPRGVRRGTVDQWDRDLAPSDGLADAFRAGELDRDGFTARYRDEMLGRAALLDWAGRMAAGTGVALLCACEPDCATAADPGCHRDILAALLEERVAATTSPRGQARG